MMQEKKNFLSLVGAIDFTQRRYLRKGADFTLENILSHTYKHTYNFKWLVHKHSSHFTIRI